MGELCYSSQIALSAFSNTVQCSVTTCKIINQYRIEQIRKMRETQRNCCNIAAITVNCVIYCHSLFLAVYPAAISLCAVV